VREDSELLLSVFVVQLGYGTPAQVMAAAGEWAARRSEGATLADVLMQRKLLDADKRRMVEGLMGQALSINGNDVARTLQSLSGGLDVLMKSISNSMTSEHPTQATPQGDSLEGSENVSDEPLGRYDFETGAGGQPHELGRGGIGRVVVVHDRYIGRDVAMKELLSEHTTNPNVATTRIVALEQRFLREARLTGQLEHPAIVPVFELGRRLNGGLYYTMQRVRGRTLAQLLAEARTLEKRLQLVAPYLTTCQAIAYAHSRAVVHRDIKPQNVMVGPFGETYVLDWGLARVKGRSDPRASDLKLQPDITGNVLEGGAIGTPSYMSPEQAGGKIEEIDERSDVWCLGAVLYELLTGTPPFTGTSPFDVLGKILKDPVRPVRKLEPDAPIELVAIAEKALQRQRPARYASAAEMAKDVGAWLQGGRVGAHDYSSLDLLRRFTKRNKVALTVAGIAAAALVGLSALAYRQVLKERDEARAFAQLFLDDVSDKLAPIAGSTPLLEQLTHKTLDYYRNTVDPKTGPRDERLRLGRAWQRIGRLASEVDKSTEAESAYLFALEIARPLVDEEPREPLGRVLLSESLIGMSDVESDRGEVEKCEAYIREAIAQGTAAVAEWPSHIDALDTLSRGYSRLASLKLTTGHPADAIEPARLSLGVDRKLAALTPDDEEMQVNVAISLDAVANVLSRAGQLDEAVKLSDESLAVTKAVLTTHPQSFNGLRSATFFHGTRATLARQLGDFDRAKTEIELAVQAGDQLLAMEPQDSQGRQALGFAEVLSGRAEKTYQRLRESGPAALEADLIDVYALSMVFTERWAEVLLLVPKSPATTKKMLCTLGAIAAAQRGDAARSAELALEAAKAGPAQLRWPVDLLSERLEHPATGLQSRAWQLARQVDAAERRADAEAVDHALNQYAVDVKPQ